MSELEKAVTRLLKCTTPYYSALELDADSREDLQEIWYELATLVKYDKEEDND